MSLQVVIETIGPAGRETDVELDGVTLMHGDECAAVSPTAAPRQTEGETGGERLAVQRVLTRRCMYVSSLREYADRLLTYFDGVWK